MNLNIENLNIENLTINGDCDSNSLTSKISPHPLWLYPSIIHNLLLKLLMDALPTTKIKTENVEEILKAKAIEINNKLGLGFDDEKVHQLSIFPPKGPKNFDKWLKDIIMTPPFNPSPEVYNIVSPIFTNVAEDRYNNSKEFMNDIQNTYKKNIDKVEDKKLFAGVMSVGYNSAKLYSDKNGLNFLGVDGGGLSQVEKVALMDMIGMFGTPITAALMSCGAIVMTS